MNLKDPKENAALTDELVALIDQWPNCDQDRAVELQEAFDQFHAAGSLMDPLPPGQKEHYCALMYEIKRGSEKRQLHFHEAHQLIQEAAKRRQQ